MKKKKEKTPAMKAVQEINSILEKRLGPRGLFRIQRAGVKMLFRKTSD